ncbi:DUF397 domain-containing protein [Streptomonospora salina]|uniref:DUF397 domain-containing protein n=1 Tax=Streptomonospora salina TaxID=104205 RepID=A0A841EE20_9ACTN|nr:DUF397 domain-containing protein [Streptomonospora salina]MBB6001236.1 hypothetical protein [Streptomonospora salina]
MSIVEGTWKKSSYSNQTGGECVEVAATSDHGAAVRDTRDRGAGHLEMPSTEWAAFVAAVRTAGL